MSLTKLSLIALSLGFHSIIAAAATSFPLKIENCGQTVRFDHIPERVVTVGQHETELLLALGLEKKIVGTSVWFGPLPGDLAARGQHLKKLADNSPGFEAVAAQSPDTVMAQYSWHIGPKGEVGTRDQFEKLGINTWISPADCINKSVTDSSNGDGARTAPFTLDYIRDEVTQVAEIFDVSARGEALNASLAARVEQAQKVAAADQKRPLNVVFWFSSSRLQGDPWVAGNYGVPGWISTTLGLKNIITSGEEWPAVTWEHIAASQPDLIVIASMNRRLYPADDVAVKQQFLHNDPVTRNIPAVKNNQIVVVPAMSLNPSLRNVDAVEKIGQFLATRHPAP